MMNTYGESATIWGAVIKMACGAQPRPIACVYAWNVRECPGVGMRSHISTLTSVPTVLSGRTTQIQLRLGLPP